jgi:hypothetical protein
MYDYCFKTCLLTVAIATVLGVAAIWVPASWYDIGAKLLWTDLVLFVGALAGASLSYAGTVKDATSQDTVREVGKAPRQAIRV